MHCPCAHAKREHRYVKPKFVRLTYELEAQDDTVNLTLIHEFEKRDSKLRAGISGGWPLILASLKSLLETGESLEQSRHWPKGI